ncbi:phage antirepressor KilAC domain-containing protein [Bacillus subtilis]|uniref:phage antirepressor n=1 Tax=Bacillus TaxID=1386 RepID=UPI000EF24C40|nr:phage antirepressor KilAC domain-containing protein [Bacillus subtilis]AYK67140.1 phage antirepressor Ant [Bacillus subtilis subsp. subtilis]MCX4077989.1 phage antirepressor KilAC domain-containing protein [Bacillus subtilis]MEC0432872.1 phage antirepressor KilAC domain-containing protein [Bacillus subtilis]WHY08607.1 phage antirepressor KilAC domain-containing protein [Bacillus subtilis]
MNQLQKVFNYQDHQVRTVVKDGQPWFVAKDVCEILGIKNATQAVSKLDNDERAMLNIGRQGNTNIVNEPGLYTLILSSRKPEAKQFKRWITHEVIPAIRKTGGYVANDELFIQTYLPQADEHIKLLFKTTLHTMKEQSKQIETMKPKVIFAEAVESSESSVLVGELAKIIQQNGVDIGPNKLFQWLRDNGYLIRKKGESFNLPTQRSMDMGLFEIKKRTVSNLDGSIRTTRTPKVTGKGQIYFVNKFMSSQSA